MDASPLTPYQLELVEKPATGRIFLSGPAGSGKTTTGVARLLNLLAQGVPENNLLVLVPQRTLAEPYVQALRALDRRAGGQVSILTVGGLARRMTDLFWPLAAEKAGFPHPELPPSFLTLETALYYMAYLVRPLLDQGLFESVTIDRNRVYSQILDNLNKAAIVGFPYTEIAERLRSAWVEDTARTHIVEDAQRCAALFREYCLNNNLLDYSLQIEVFVKQLWNEPACRTYLNRNFTHLIYDNIEEDTPVSHKLVREWLPELQSAFLIYDDEAGYRRFLGADPESGFDLVEVCDEHHVFSQSLVAVPALESFSGQMGRALERPGQDRYPLLRSDELRNVLLYPDRPLRFYPQMLDWVAGNVAGLVEAGTPPGEIVLLAPMLPDSLRFALTNRLAELGIPYRSHRPSRSLREEPATQALLTLAALAHPQWGLRPSRFELAYTLIQAIDEMDLVRSQLLVEAAYRPTAGQTGLTPFELIAAETRERITYNFGSRYEILRLWLEAYRASIPVELDFFFSRLFGEVLSQRGFAFHANLETGTVSQNLIESAQKFRWAVGDRIPTSPEREEQPVGKEYLAMIQDGILAAQYIQSWQIPPDNAVLISPAYTFLLANQPVDYQIWIDVGSSGWSERLYQPLTHPYILSQHWHPGHVWTDVDEYEHSRDNLYRLVLGLVRRCRRQVFLGLSELGESGFEARGLLLRAIQIVLQQSRGYSR